MAVDRYRFERVLHRNGCLRIAGVDETGRGALAGPLVAAAVVLPAGFTLDGINDSKQLTPRKREAAYERIVIDASYVVGHVEATVIDRDGMKHCNIELFRRLIQELEPSPDFVLIDGTVPVPDLGIPSRIVTKGDARSASIAAASIVAKVTRDRMMDGLHEDHPEYGFDRNRGYGPAQWEPIERLGPIPGVHRASFKRRRQTAGP